MNRSPLFLLGLGLLVLLGPAPGVRAEERWSLVAVAKLKQAVKFKGYVADSTLTLEEMLNHLADRYDLTFDVNENAFRLDNVEDTLQTAIAKLAMPPMFGARLETVLCKILSRIPAASGATYVIRPDRVEITTMAAVRQEFWGKDHPGPYLPLVHAEFNKSPLEQALKDLAEQADFNIVLDGRIEEKGKTAVTARLSNVPLDTAVRMLADMADLQPVLMDNTLYVTTRDNAARLEKQQQKPAKPNAPPPEEKR
jgi:hypothetical protein